MALFIVSIGVSELFKGFTDCFIAGTLVLTSIGLVKIEDIKEGDEVWAYNEETGEKALKKVVNLFRKETKEWMHLFVESPISKVTEEIICTPSHRIYIEEKGWMKASEIVENDEVLLYNSNSGVIRKIELEKLELPEVTYNFEVEDYHNYFVSEERILVHNDCNPNIENSNPLENLKYTDKVKNDKLKGDNHSFPDIVDNYGIYGKQSTIIGGDGKVYNQVEIEGSYNGSLGVFEYKYDQNNVCNHRFFSRRKK